MRTIKHTCKIYASVADVWQALVDPKLITKWGGGPAIMNDKEGASFKLWGGKIYGTNTKVVPMKKLIQDWYSGKWEKPTIVSFTLQKKTPELTYLILTHTNVPDSDARDISAIWLDSYLDPLKKTVEKYYD